MRAAVIRWRPSRTKRSAPARVRRTGGASRPSSSQMRYRSIFVRSRPRSRRRMSASGIHVDVNGACAKRLLSRGRVECGRVESNHHSQWRRGYSALSSPMLGVRGKTRAAGRIRTDTAGLTTPDAGRYITAARLRGGTHGSPRTPSFRSAHRSLCAGLPGGNAALRPHRVHMVDREAGGRVARRSERNGRRDRLPATGGRDVTVRWPRSQLFYLSAVLPASLRRRHPLTGWPWRLVGPAAR